MKIISFEGIEGVGKSTQINLLQSYLEKQDFTVDVLREPGSTTSAEHIREILLNKENDISKETELLLMFAARSDLINKRIQNNDSDFVLFDRYYDASIAYQGYGRGIPLEFIENLIMLIKCPKPDVSFLFDLSVEDSFSRKKLDVKDRIESSGNSFFERVKNGYLEIAKNQNERFHIIDATKEINEIHNIIKKVLEF